MNSSEMRYFQQTQKGRSVWWAWIFATWVAIILWIVGQSFLIGVMMGVATVLSPEIATAFSAIQQSSLSEADLESYTQLTGLSSLLGLVGVIGVFVTVYLSNKNRLILEKAESFGGKSMEEPDTTIFITVLLGTIAAIVLSSWLFMRANSLIDASDYMDIMSQALGLNPVTFALFLLTFPLGCLGLYFMQRVIHRRSITSLHTGAERIKWNRIFEGFILTWVILGAFVAIGSVTGLIDIRYVFNSQRFWGFAIVSLLLIPLQAGAEEVFFRGYLNQGLTHLTRNKWIAFSLSSLAFMAMHLSNPEALAGASTGTLPIVMSGYLFFGIAMCILVWLDDGLETAIGVHAGNNCFAAIFVNYEGSVLPTPSVFLANSDPIKDSLSTILVLAAIIAVFWWRRGGPDRSGGTPSTAGA